MTRRNIYGHYGIYLGGPITDRLASACYYVTGVYPADLKELKKAMLGHELSLLLNSNK